MDDGLVYVCVVSGYNLPELEACLLREPGDVVLVVSDRMGESCRRLERVLRERLPRARLHRLDGERTGRALEGDDVVQCAQWVEEVLLPFLEGLGPLRRVLNLNGGTKAMAAALLWLGVWSELDYKAQGRQELQVTRPETVDGSRRLVEVARRPLPDVSPQDVARLHGEPLDGRPNALEVRDPAGTVALGRALWDGLAAGDEGLLRLFAGLGQVWSTGREDPAFAREVVVLPWSAFGEGDRGALRPWLDRLGALAPGVLVWSEEGVRLPGNRAKGWGRAWREWVSGAWLEQLAQAWLEEAGVPPGAIARNLRSSEEPGRGGEGREADLLVHFRGRTVLVEVKADLPPGAAPSELERQVASLGDRFGSTQKALLIGPQGMMRLGGGARREAFARRCRDSRIALLAGREDLVALVLGRRPAGVSLLRGVS